MPSGGVRYFLRSKRISHMTTFIFGDYIYETPIFVIKALKKAEIPEAL